MIMEITEVIKYPLATEKSIRLMESENKLKFVVDRRANKFEVKKAIEETFNVKVDNVRTFISPSGEKRAYIKFNKSSPAIDVATNLGLM